MNIDKELGESLRKLYNYLAENSRPPEVGLNAAFEEYFWDLVDDTDKEIGAIPISKKEMGKRHRTIS